MPKPSEIISAVAVLMNDASQSLYTNTVCLPLFNLSLDELQEVFELNGIPVTNETSAVIAIPAGVNRLGHDTTPALPSDLIEVKQLFESQSGQDNWIPMTKKEFLPHQYDNVQMSYFQFWTLEGGRIKFLPASGPLDLKIDYTASMFNTPILIKDINVNLPFTNIKTYLEYKTAAMCSMYIAENETRAMSLDSLATKALDRAMGIPIKSMQSIITRRRPFRAAYKQRGVRL